MNPTLPQRVRTAPDVLYQELDGEAVLLNLANEQYYGLDSVGTRMWTLLNTAPSIAAAMDTLLDEYEVEPAQLQTDLHRLINELAAQGLIQVENDALA